MKKDSFIRGMFSAYTAIVFTKILGVLYSIPFYDIIGDEGGVIYSCVYNVYVLFLDIATCGIPVAVSIILSEYHTRKLYRSERKAYSAALRIILSLAVLSFAIMQLFADQIAAGMLADMDNGVAPAVIARGIRIVSVCMLIVPFLSIRRGQLQGYKYVTVSSRSQVIEQLVRIAVSLVGSYVVIRVLKRGVELGVDMAFVGTVLSALVALIYVGIRGREAARESRAGAADQGDDTPMGQIIRRLIRISVPIIFVSLTYSIYSVVDMKLILVGLHDLRYGDEDAQVIASIASTWAPRICMIITALPMGIVSSIAPFMAESNTAHDAKAVTARLNQALGVLLLISVPLGAGMILLSEPTYRLFYGPSAYGGEILALLIVVNVIGGISTVMSTTMQSVGRGKAVCVTIFTGIVLNATLDLPLIHLFSRIGLPAYLGAATASIIGQTVTVAMQTAALKKSHGFSPRPVLRHTLRILCATAVMLLAVFLLRLLWPVSRGGRVLVALQLLAFALVGGLIYFTVIYVLQTAEQILGRAAYNRVLDRFHIRGFMDRLLFFPALWAGKLLLWIYGRTGHRQNDKPGMAALRLCDGFLKYAAKPKLTIVVSGTNGKTSISCMVANILKLRGMTVSYTDWGANDRGGNAWCILNAVNIFNRPTKDAAVIEMDELVCRRNVPQVKPNYLIINNLARDSMLRNATPEFVEAHLHSAAEHSPNTVVIGNADDPLSCSIGEHNRCVRFGVADLHLTPSASLHDLALCPNCFAKLDYKYRNFRHIGPFSCPVCGFASPDIDVFVEGVDRARRTVTVRSAAGTVEYPMISGSTHNIYNEAAIIAMFLDMGVSPEDLKGYLAKTSLPASRETKCEANGIAVYTKMAKGQNATATSSAFESVIVEPGVKELILLLDETYDSPGETETAAWIFDVRYECLNDPRIKKIIVGGDRYLDHRVSMLMAGIPEEKLVCIPQMPETAQLVDTQGIDAIYILHDVNYVSRAHKVRDEVQKRIREAGRCGQ